MNTSYTLGNPDEIQVEPSGIERSPVLAHFKSDTYEHGAIVFMSYEQAIDLSRQLRIACGIDLPREKVA